ncbi:hypothetical protein SDRG_11911 [Saprolegnia diclina VS20]|uniref:CCHC-type domain-containing protein n=1 Tax=Saprolegnia diclina (strain VS20) TaxID=1156394 RepID=T0PXQ8_SAPDV|nr:hypothetical protein SDRG_11911 [Saprolegnia diclina VS20]EQC30334.1 hypothetical protein SDRG_11911 [Saprolegnia diclina VS20]|eukprot:XP_008616187.1 hypothetical protein SDRG_11911 [Saprolegnia diclina VS20]
MAWPPTGWPTSERSGAPRAPHCPMVRRRTRQFATFVAATARLDSVTGSGKLDYKGTAKWMLRQDIELVIATSLWGCLDTILEVMWPNATREELHTPVFGSTASLFLALFSKRKRSHKVDFSDHYSLKKKISGRNTMAAPGQAAMAMSGVVVLSQLVHPEFKSIARRDVVAWKRARLEYETSMRRECQQTNRSYAATCVPVRDSFTPVGYLEFLMKTSWDLWDDYNLQNVPEEKLWEQINAIIDTRANQAVLTYDKIFTSLELDYGEEDVRARVSNFLFKADQAIEDNGLSDKLQNSKLKANIFKALIQRLRPQELETDVMQLLEEKLAVNNQAGLQHLEKIILKRAFFYKSWSPKTKRLRDKESSGEDEKPSHKEQQGVRKKKKRKLKQKDNKPPVRQERKNDGTERPCWHCGSKKHKLRDCPSSSAKQKAIAVKKNWKSSRRGGGGDGSKQGGNEGNGALLSGSEGHMALTLNSVLDVPCVPDSGCGLNTIPATMAAARGLVWLFCRRPTTLVAAGAARDDTVGQIFPGVAVGGKATQCVKVLQRLWRRQRLEVASQGHHELLRQAERGSPNRTECIRKLSAEMIVWVSLLCPPMGTGADNIENTAVDVNLSVPSAIHDEADLATEGCTRGKKRSQDTSDEALKKLKHS